MFGEVMAGEVEIELHEFRPWNKTSEDVSVLHAAAVYSQYPLPQTAEVVQRVV